MNTLLECLWQDPLIQSLGWTLLHFLWQGAVLAGLFAMARFCLRSFSANARYMVGSCILLLMVFAIAVTFCREIPQSPISKSATIGKPAALALNESRPVDTIRVTAISVSKAGAMNGTWERFRNMQSSLGWTLPWVVAIWILGVGILSLRLIAGALKVRLITKQNNQPAGEVWLERLTELKQRLGISHPVRLLQSWSVEVPTVIGWFKPVILFPASTLCGLGPGHIESLLLHELAHIRRHDYLVNLMQCAVETLLFYHPAVWWVSRNVRQERENCCDDLAVQVSGDVLQYTRALATLEEARNQPMALALAADGKPLLRRIQRLIRPNAPHRFQARTSGGLFGILLLMTIFVALPVARSQKAPPGGESGATNGLPAASSTHVFAEANFSIPEAKPALFTRIFKVDPNIFISKVLELVESKGRAMGTTNASAYSADMVGGFGKSRYGGRNPNPGSAGEVGKFDLFFKALQDCLKDVGYDPSTTGRQLSFNHSQGFLMVRATFQELDKIEKFVQVMNYTPPQVTLECQIVELTGNFARQFHLEKVFGGAALYTSTNDFEVLRNDLQRRGAPENIRISSNGAAVVSILSAPQYRTLIEKLRSIPEVNLLNLPKVTTMSSRQTQIKVVGVRYEEVTRDTGALTRPPIVGRGKTPGEDTEVGTSVDVVPYVGADGYAIEMTVIPTLPGENGHSWQVVTSIALYDSQTELIQAAIGDKLVLTFTTPTIIDPAGNRVHPEEEMPFTKVGVPPQPNQRVRANRSSESKAGPNKRTNIGTGMIAEMAADRKSPRVSKTAEKINTIIIPEFKFEADTMLDVAKQLTAVAKQNDPDRKGVNFMISVPLGVNTDAPFDTKLVIDLKNISLANAIERVCSNTGFEFSTLEHAVILTPKSKP